MAEAKGRFLSNSAVRPSWLAGLVLACSAVLLAPLVDPLLTNRVFVYNDLSWFHLPVRLLYQEALLAGDTVLWTPSLFSGFYLHGEGQGGFFHPLHQLLYRALSLRVAFNLELVASYPLAFGGMYWLLRRLRCSPTASLFGAMLYTFSGFNLLHYQHVNMVAVLAHMPWLLAAADMLIVDRGTRSTLASAAIAIVVGSEILLGFPQAVWWNMLTLGLFAPFRAWETQRWRGLVRCLGAVGVGVMIGGIQLLPTLDLVRHSLRADVTREFALTYSLHPFNLLQLWSPYAFARGAYSAGSFMWFHEFGIYSGAVLPVALAWAWIRRSALPDRRALIVWATVVAVLAFILALGEYGGLATLLTYLPGVGSFRAPARYVFLMQFALVILAAVMMDDLLAIADGAREAPSSVSVVFWIPVALGVATLILLNGRMFPFGRRVFVTAADAAPGVLVCAVVSLLVFVAARRARWALVALIMLIMVTAADLAAWGLRFVYQEPPRRIGALWARVPRAPEAPADRYAAAPPGPTGPFQNMLILRGYRLTTGYVGLFPATAHPLESELTARLSGTRWRFDGEATRTPVEDSVARVRLLDEHGREATGIVRLTVDRPGRLVVDVDAPGRHVLALTERFHEGWSASIGGVNVPTLRVDHDFLGTTVDGGIQRVEFTFMPRSFTYGAVLSAVGTLLLIGMVLASRR